MRSHKGILMGGRHVTRSILLALGSDGLTPDCVLAKHIRPQMEAAKGLYGMGTRNTGVLDFPPELEGNYVVCSFRIPLISLKVKVKPHLRIWYPVLQNAWENLNPKIASL